MLSHLYEEGYQANTFSPSAPPTPRVSTALIAIGQYSSTIETVDAGWCKDITDQGATQIAQSSKSLRYLGLMRCDKVRRSLQRSLLQVRVTCVRTEEPSAGGSTRVRLILLKVSSCLLAFDVTAAGWGGGVCEAPRSSF